MKKLKNKIDYKKPTKDSYDSERLSRVISDEFGQWAEPDPKFNFKDIIENAKKKGKSVKLKFSKPKQ